jgi:hypothetical protein
MGQLESLRVLSIAQPTYINNNNNNNKYALVVLSNGESSTYEPEMKP